jgi:hypothetical protein
VSTAEDPPRYVVASAVEATTVLRRLARAGWRTAEGFGLTESTWDLTDTRMVRYGRIPDLDTVRLAVLAAARGVGVVAIADVTGEVGRALVADLSRLGPVGVDSRADSPAGSGAVPGLVPEQRALLERLANGETIAAAAAAEFLSLRTANRRIARARVALGVRTTREAVLAYLRQRDAGR